MATHLRSGRQGAPEESPILVTGAHRSGTTWAGKILSGSPEVGYIHEPFNITGPPGLQLTSVDKWYHYVEGDAPQLERELRSFLDFNLDLVNGLRECSRPGDLLTLVRNAISFYRHRSGDHRPLLKDPLAFLSAPWISQTFDASVVVLVRHPAGFAGSLKAAGWTFPFDHLLSQESLIEGPLSHRADEIRRAAREDWDIVDQASLLWNLVYGRAIEYEEEHPDWLFVRHEDMARNPTKRFRRLADSLGLEFGDGMAEKLQEHKDPQKKSSGGPLDFVRDPSSVIWNWNDRLSPGEIDRVKQRTETVAREFYSEPDWHPPDD